MAVQVIGAGLGRTGTYSLKLALERLGLGPCHHMEEVLKDAARQIPLWSAAVQGRPDWDEALKGYGSTVDWPSAAFWAELAAAYPDAKIVLSTRSAESWAESFGGTIQALFQKADEAPAEMASWFEMGFGVLHKSGFRADMSRVELIAAYQAHLAAVKAGVPAARLLVFEVKEGWGPLCAFLGKPVPDEPFPRSNNREEFWDLAAKVTG